MITQPASMILRAYLAEQGAIQTPADAAGDLSKWPCFISNLPDKPRNVISLFDVRLTKEGREMRGRVSQRYDVQIRIRADTFLVGAAKLKQIIDLLDAVSHTTISVLQYDYMVPCVVRESVLFMGTEDADNVKTSHWSINTSFHVIEHGPYTGTPDDVFNP